MRRIFGECHAHIIMDGLNYRKAIAIHKEQIDDRSIREHLKVYQKLGITFLRDGGDALGVSKRAKDLAAEYGIDYRTPIFAIHKNGHYGAIVGKGFDNMKEYYALVKEAKKQGADFIKIMTTGLLDFNNHGQVTGNPLNKEEVREMVHIAHEEGFAVMSHTNGIYGVQAAVEAGVNSLEHGNYMDKETIEMLAESDTVWVPTLVTIRNLWDCGRYEEQVLKPIIELSEKNLRMAWNYKAKVALGSDAGAYMVPHGIGLLNEYQAVTDILGESEDVISWLKAGEKKIQDTFKRPES